MSLTVREEFVGANQTLLFSNNKKKTEKSTTTKKSTAAKLKEKLSWKILLPLLMYLSHSFTFTCIALFTALFSSLLKERVNEHSSLYSFLFSLSFFGESRFLIQDLSLLFFFVIVIPAVKSTKEATKSKVDVDDTVSVKSCSQLHSTLILTHLL